MIDTIKRYTPINFELAGNPVNWAIVLLMVAIAGLSFRLIFQSTSVSSGD